MKKDKLWMLIVLITIIICSCKKDFLEKRPDVKLVKLSVSDCQAILDNTMVMNEQYPQEGDMSCDDYFLNDSRYTSSSDAYSKELYKWDKFAQRPFYSGSWLNSYQTIYNANLVISTIEQDGKNSENKNMDEMKGSGYFFRAFMFHQLAMIYCNSYNTMTANEDLGIPIRTNPYVETLVNRGTVKLTYNRIIQDLKLAAQLLPKSSSVQTRPNKNAAYAALSRVYLDMQDYSNSELYADSSLFINDRLINYNELNTSILTPFSRFNIEVIYHATRSLGLLNNFAGCVDSTLFSSYDQNDLRKSLFYKKSLPQGYGVTGSYSGNAYQGFSGLAIDEIYLIKAECLARRNNITDAMKTLNSLLVKRWKAGTFIDKSAANQDQSFENNIG